ncbi:MAG: glutamine-hydrolyzing carbamoyl-phosphate synthase small subunit [Actinomycetota bacterium]|nr:glutamine-hydrolyzing carbamoyl-phosphate synthase small subunit [Actinomycetota bacterium]
MKSSPVEGLLVLADGARFEGEMVGAAPHGGVATGELVFNTVMSGYQEVVTDPSYAGQVVCFTYPHIGNYGTSAADDESRRAWCRGIVVRDFVGDARTWRADGDLGGFLRAHGVVGITGVDTRRLTRHIRSHGSMGCAFGTAAEDVLAAAAAADPGTEGVDLVSGVTTPEGYTAGTGPIRIVAYDFGIKSAMVASLASIATVDVVPASTAAADVLARDPDGVFLSNGPGDPAAVPWAVDAVADLLGRVPVFGICLGHQVLALALGASTYKLTFGHHGGNHPVQRAETGQVEITSQNHNYAVRARGGVVAEGVEVTHVNLNDGVVEGIRSVRARAFSVQYHPEAAPGPHDARYLFGTFRSLLGVND